MEGRLHLAILVLFGKALAFRLRNEANVLGHDFVPSSLPFCTSTRAARRTYQASLVRFDSYYYIYPGRRERQDKAGIGQNLTSNIVDSNTASVPLQLCDIIYTGSSS